MRFPTRLLMALAALCLIALPARAQDYPEFERQSLYVPVRDGTRLAVNIYRPADASGVETDRLPVVFAFTPYRARFTDAEGNVQETALGDGLALRSLIRAGYVVAVADIRGKGASFGSRRGFQDRTEAMDGHDLVEWLAAQPFSSGAVGMIGCSYLGGSVMHTASTAPPSLRAVFVGATDWDKYEFVRQGGITAQFNTRPDEPLSDDLASVPVDADPNGELLRAAVAQHAANTPMAALWYGMPYRDSVSPLTGNAFWDEVAMWRYADTIRDAGIATYFWSNWQDEPTAQVIVAAENLGSRLLVGPGSHCQTPAGFDFTGEITRYFDHHLKGADNGEAQAPRVTWWRHTGGGEGEYVRGNDRPGAARDTLSYYLGGSAEDGGLALAPVPGGEGASTFTVDYDVMDDAYFAFWPPSLAERGLAYATAPVAQPFDLAGYPVAHLAVKLDRPDANVFVYLEEVLADGTVEVLSFGRLMISHRAVSEAPWDTLGMPWHSGRAFDVAPLTVGETGHLAIAMQPLSRRVAAGSRLRFVVTGADPRQRNLAEIREDPAPEITVVQGWLGGSRIDLPLVR
ncbi:CocE/NonD family hydrolase [Altererythrobacter sp. KTW20L]|uniref:CocE/NonD family hydrolase n=1 Tax=Altererythrobacter sp. KTW20L TaxID=2942210 RepID=UPI0020C0B0E8|nr:CocE/NonD family hydrolase [Altererythrobacter sp. KTW20L]MCL6249699.1 CocE/NonD family hydrolase [Altererythrobacter sp. KTW20L]